MIAVLQTTQPVNRRQLADILRELADRVEIIEGRLGTLTVCHPNKLEREEIGEFVTGEAAWLMLLPEHRK